MAVWEDQSVKLCAAQVELCGQNALEQLPGVECRSKVAAFVKLPLRQSRPIRQNAPTPNRTAKEQGCAACTVVGPAAAIGGDGAAKFG